MGADGQVVPQQWLAHTTAPGVPAGDRRRLDVVVYGAAPRGGALCCDATLVSPLTRGGQPQPGAAETDGAVLRVAERRKLAAYPELGRGGPQRLVVLGSEVGGRWNGDAQRFVRDLLRVRAQCAPPALRTAASAGWSRRWWGMLGVAVQHAVTSTALGCAWPAPLHPSQHADPPLERVLELAAPTATPPRLRADRLEGNRPVTRPRRTFITQAEKSVTKKKKNKGRCRLRQMGALGQGDTR